MVTSPTREQFAELLATLRKNPFSQEAVPFVEFLAYSGMRLEEVNEVRWKDVDFTNDLLKITGGETGTKNHSQHVIPLFPPLKALLLRISDGKNMPPS